MKMIIESTSKVVTLNGVPARIWDGKTENGVAFRRLSDQCMENMTKEDLDLWHLVTQHRVIQDRLHRDEGNPKRSPTSGDKSK